MRIFLKIIIVNDISRFFVSLGMTMEIAWKCQRLVARNNSSLEFLPGYMIKNDILSV